MIYNTIYQHDLVLQNKNIKKRFHQEERSVNKIERSIEVKNVYYDKNDIDITNDKQKWVNSGLNKSIIKFSWDNKSKVFKFDVESASENAIDLFQLSININNDKKQNLQPKKINGKFCYNFTSADIFDGFYNTSTIKTIQFVLEPMFFSSPVKRRIVNIVFNDYNVQKNDFIINKNEKMTLNFQKSLTIKGDEIKKDFGNICFEPLKIEQGVWNQEFVKITESSKEIFERNKVEFSSIDNLPVTSKSTSNFSAYLDQYDDFSKVKISQNTYYDLSKKETIKGFGQNSNPGYIVPFEFSGSFFPYLKLIINDLEFHISWEENFDKPYFKSFEGLNKIYLTTHYENDSSLKWNQITLEDLEMAREYNLTFNEFLTIINNKGENHSS